MEARLRSSAIVLLVGAALVSGVSTSRAEIGFSAQYHLLLDGDDFCGLGDDLVVTRLRMSGDGSTIALAGYCSVSGAGSLSLIDTATAQRAEVPWPGGVGSIWADSLSIDHDGSRVFFVDYPRDSLFVVEGGVATKILDRDDWEAINGVYRTRCLPDGSWVYFNEDRDDLWRVSAMGGVPERVVDDQSIDLGDGKTGWSVDEFDVSDDGATIGFVLKGYRNPSLVQKTEVFVQSGSSVTQLTDETWDAFPYYQGKSHLELDASGAVLTYMNSAVDRWIALRPATGLQTWLEPSGFNVGGSSVTADGSRLFYYDTEARGGRLTRTDGSGGMDLFPRWNVATITIAAVYDPQTSRDGSRVAFASGNDIYFGLLDPAEPSPRGPSLGVPTFEPPWVLAGIPSPQVLLIAPIGDPDGLSDVWRTATDELIGGKLAGWSEIPIEFHDPVHDDGQPPDPIAGDGDFCSTGDEGGAWGAVDTVTVRIAARDLEGNVTLIDTDLFVCPAGGCWIFADDFETGDISAW